MGSSNQTVTTISEFIVNGFSGLQDEQSQIIIFVLLFVIYIIVLLGNLSILILIKLDEALHTPMYMLISVLACVDICIPSVTVPKMLTNFVFHTKAILFGACFTQMVFYIGIGTMESFLLMVMAYDRYVAICNPLHYPTIMTTNHIVKLCFLCWIGGMMTPMVPLYLALRLPFCGPNIVLHSFCDYSAVVRLACADVTLNAIVSLTIAMSVLLIPLAFIVFSYFKIIRSVLKVASSEGRRKAFSTCAAHLFVITLFYLVAVFVFISYRISGFSTDARIMAAVLQNLIPPMVNPVIYCLKTKDIQKSFFRLLHRRKVTKNDN
ncbi:olfactory receptor 6N1-like [Polypterus senegalus]|uniref:olfactory receptor 6N1-like n=1 Tax=Polypterus senegalus TaxID=55291 RepID=UPI001964BCD8|nr:olfactory receptor 6N1-like [Polypterus senegalus]